MMTRLRSARQGRDTTSENEPAKVDEQAYDRLYKAYGPILLAYAMKMSSGDRHLAEDVVQETLLRAWRNMDRLDMARETLRPWLYTVARRIMVDMHRRRASRPPEVDGSALNVLRCQDGIDAMLSSVIVSDALASLSKHHRDVIREVYYRGSGVREAAKTLGIPQGTVKSRTYFALKALRLAFEERGIIGLQDVGAAGNSVVVTTH